MKKRLLSIILTLSMLLSLLPTAAFAADGTTEVSDWAGFTAALNDGTTTTISLTAGITSPQDADDLLTLSHAVTIQGNGYTITLNRGGIVLGADVAFEDITLNLTNMTRNAIIANGHTLTLKNVKKAADAAGGIEAAPIHLFCGTVTGYTGTETLPAEGPAGKIVISGTNNDLGDIFAGSLSEYGAGNVWSGGSTITIEPGASGFGSIYAHGATEPRDGSDPRGMKNDATNYTVTGGVTINLSNTTATVDGATGGDSDATVNFNASSGNQAVHTLTNIGKLELSGTSPNLAPQMSSTIDAGATVTLPANSKLDLSNLGNITIGSLSGGGTLVLGSGQMLTIGGAVSGTTSVSVSAAGECITAAGSDDTFGSESFVPASEFMELTKDENGVWTAEWIYIPVTDFTLTGVTVTTDDTSASLPVSVTYADNANALWEADFAANSFTVKVNGNEAVPGSTSYVDSVTGFELYPHPTEEYFVVEFPSGVTKGAYEISVTVPADSATGGAAITRTATLTVTDDSGNSGETTSYPVWVGGVQVTSANQDDVLGTADNGATVTYNPSINTLTLSDANITAASVTAVDNGSPCGIYAAGDLNIKLEGTENTINGVSATGTNSSYGISCTGSLIISGGSLEVSGGAASSESYGIWAQSCISISGDSHVIATGDNGATYNGTTTAAPTVTGGYYGRASAEDGFVFGQVATSGGYLEIVTVGHLGGYTQSNDTHSLACAEGCTIPATVIANEACTGGTATCETKATCTTCQQEYGELAAHSYAYGAPSPGGNNYFVETCANNCGHSARADVVMPSTPTSYDGEPKAVTVTYSNNWAGAKSETIKYSGANYTETTTAPTDAGTYTVSIDINGAKYSGATFTITKADALDISPVVKEFVRTATTTGNVVDIAALLPADQGTATYSVTSSSYTSVENVSINESTGLLTFATKASESETTDTITVKAEMLNYADTTITVTVKLVNKTPVTITGVSAFTGLTYNGSAQQGYTGTPTGYTGTLEITYTGRNGTSYNSITAPTNAGDYTVTFKVPDSDPTYTGSESLDFSIAKKQITVPTQPSAVTYNGGAQTYGVASNSDYTITGGVQTNANETGYNVTIALTDTVNTEWASGSTGNLTQKFIINKAAITVTADNKTAIAGAVQPELTYTVTGLQGADQLTTLPTLSCSPDMDTAGEYVITISGAAQNSGNYTITHVNGKLTVSNKTAVEITGVTAQDGTYNGSAQQGYTGTPAGYTGTLEITYTGRGNTTYGPSTTAPTNAGDYTVTFKVPDSDQTHTGSKSLDFTIGTATITVTADNKTAIVGAAQPELTYTVSGLKGTDQLTTLPTLSCSSDMDTAGEYVITISGAAQSSGNYTITHVNSKLTVSNKTTPSLTLTPSSASLSGGGAITLTVGGLPTGGSVTITCDNTTYNPTGSGTTWSVTLPNTTATYVFTASFAGDDTHNSATATCIVTVTRYTAPSNGGSSGGGSSSNTTTTTERNPDGSTTTTTTDKTTGTVIETTKNTDGSTTTVETKTDGTVTTTDKKTDGSTTTVETKTDGSVTTTDQAADGSTVTTVADAGGNVTAGATVSEEAGTAIVEEAKESGSTEVVIAPEVTGDATKTEVSIPASTVESIGNETAANLTVSTPVADVTIPNEGMSALVSKGGDVTVTAEKTGNTVTLAVTSGGEAVSEVTGGVTLTVPHENTKPGTVAVIVYEDGTREVIPKSVPGDGSVTIPLTGSATVELVDNSKRFDDVPDNAWQKDAVDFVSARGLLNGTSATTFSADAPMTRGMLAVVLHNLESNPDHAFTGSFDDVADGAWYTEAILWAAESGVVSGYGDGSYGAEDNISREQLAVMLWRYAGSPAATKQKLDFSDADEAGDWAVEALIWAQENGIMQGYNNAVDPKGTATRAHVAQMFKNFMENIMK